MEIIYSLVEIDSVAQQLISKTKSKILAFYGPMGAGKTTLIKALVTQLGGANEVHSPTFGLVNEYMDKAGELLGYHFDFYRLNNEMEALDIGIEDYFDSKAWIFMEWPEKISGLLPEDTITLKIEILSSKTRRIIF